MRALALVASLHTPPVELDWRAPPECPTAVRAHATIEALLAGHASGPERRVIANVAITHVGPLFRASVRIDDGTSVGERELESASCEEVADAAALIVAMAIDPRLAAEPPAGDDESIAPIPTPPPEASARVDRREAAPPVRTSTSVATEPSPAVGPSRRTRLRGLARAAAGIGYGSVPAVSGVVMIAMALAGRRWRIELDADVWTPRTRTSAKDPALGVRVLGWTIGARGCGSPLAGRLEIPLCAGVRAGALHGRGVGPLESRRRIAPWFTVTFGVGVWGWVTSRFALALDVDGIVTPRTPAFDLQPSGFTVRTPPAGVRAVFGPVLRWP